MSSKRPPPKQSPPASAVTQTPPQSNNEQEGGNGQVPYWQLKERHPFWVTFFFASIAASSSWVVAQRVMVSPRDDRISQLDKQLIAARLEGDELKKNLRFEEDAVWELRRQMAPSAVSKNVSAPSPSLCSSFVSRIQQPKDGEIIPARTRAAGTITPKLTSSHAWLLVYYPDSASYLSARQVDIDANGRWSSEITVVGAMAGRAVQLELVLADADAHAELNRFSKERPLPSTLDRCHRVSVTVQ